MYVLRNAKHEEERAANGIENIDLVVLNLYPFEATVQSGADFSTCVENIDIGGPSMLRSSSKNHAYVAIITSPAQYTSFISEFEKFDGSTTITLRRQLAAQAFATSAAYDAAIASYFASQVPGAFPIATKVYEPQMTMKYGCNPHQKPATIYRSLGSKLPFTVINGTPGYINLLDACNAWQLVSELKQAVGLPAAASFKHCSPAGAAVGIPLTADEAKAYEISDPSSLSPTALAYIRARNADPVSLEIMISINSEIFIFKCDHRCAHSETSLQSRITLMLQQLLHLKLRFVTVLWLLDSTQLL